MRFFIVLSSAIALLIATCGPARAQTGVTSIGDVSPADRPFEQGNQGIPTAGNTVVVSNVNTDGNLIDIFGNVLLDEQGRVVGQINYERNANIEVGRFSTGQLLMTGGSTLRFGDLIIGGDGDIEVGSNTSIDVEMGQFGTGGTGGVGTVEIVGAGTIYNNHPRIVPTIYQDFGDPEATTFAIPTGFDPGPDLGGVPGNSDETINIARPDSLNAGPAIGSGEFDLYVGLTGTGFLNILDGGRGEIRDGAFIGVGPNAVGRVSVNGPGSYLGIYGMKDPVSGGGQDEDNGQTVIGPYGNGTLEILNGGRVDSFNRAALGATNAEGDEGDRDQTLAGGRGDVLVDGSGSTWRVFTGEQGSNDDDSAMTIGEFFDGVIGGGPGSQMDTRFNALISNPIAYEADFGSGRLTIRNGGLVTVLEDNITNSGQDDGAGLRIGLYGELQLNGGRIDVGGRVDNDGLIRTGDNFDNEDRYGDGEIDSLTFLNSPRGIVSVRASEKLTIRSFAEQTAAGAGDFQTVMAGVTPATPYFYANAGKIEVLGDQAIGKAEIEFVRDADTSLPDGRFKNLRFDMVPTQNGGVTTEIRGEIKAQDANLFFRSDLLNEGDLLFVGGENVVTGAVTNSGGPNPAPGAVNDDGLILITNGSHVTFQDSVQNAGTIVINDSSDVVFGGNLVISALPAAPPPPGTPNSVLGGLPPGGQLIDLNPASITVEGNLGLSGLLDFVIGGGESGFEFTRLFVAGNARFEAGATMDVNTLSTGNLAVGDSFDLLTVADTIVAGDIAPGNIMQPDPASGLLLVPDRERGTDGIWTLSVEALLPAAMFVGGDVNGDGIVDLADVAIWQMFFGIQSGASPQLGDTDGDGDVDAADLANIFNQLGGVPMPIPVTLPGSGAGAANTPEPAAAVLGLIAMLALARSPRRRGR